MAFDLNRGTQQMSNSLVYGSLQDTALRANKTVAETFMDVDALVLVDTSFSMDERDCPGGRKRYDLACEQLIRLQRELPGKVGVISWNSSPSFCPGGIPTTPYGGTNLTGALEFVKPVDGTTIKLIIISDGEPDQQEPALALAKTFKSKIDTIYVGPERGYGRAFLRLLAEATGGRPVTKSIKEIGLLSETVKGLLAA
jgi:hypothetical protein